MTDVILEDKQGRRTHHFIDDNCPAIVYVRERATLRVKRLSESLESKLDRLLKVLTEH